jgi:hypothetical protein
MPKPNEVAQIDFIVDCLRKGEARKIILAKFVKKWQGKSNRTFDRRLRQAESALQGEQQAVKAKSEESINQAIEARKANILSAIDRQELLSKIANGDVKVKKPFVIGGKIMEYPSEPDHLDKIKAIAELNKMDGSYDKSDEPQTTVKIIIE